MQTLPQHPGEGELGPIFGILSSEFSKAPTEDGENEEAEEHARWRNQKPLNGGVSNVGVSRSGLVGTFPIFLGFSQFSRGWSFPICSGIVRGFSRLVLFLFLGLFRAPTRNSPERVR